MANWSGLPLDITIEIGEKIEYYEDFIRFGVVCKNWRDAMKLVDPPSVSGHTPWLLFSEPSNYGDGQWHRSGRLYSIDKECVVGELDLPYQPSTQLLENDSSIDLRPLFVQERWTYFSTRGWLVYINETIHDVVLVHPISKEIIQCPPIPCYLSQEISECTDDNPASYDQVMFALSETPSSIHQYSLAMIFIGYNVVAVWHSTENEWLIRKFPNNVNIMNITFYMGNLYFVDRDGKVVAFENEKAINLESPWPRDFWRGCSVYLVESAGKLLIIRRKLVGYNNNYIKTLYFKVWEVNIDDGQTKKVSDLGNNALFLGYNSSFSINTSISYVWPNCIYYIGDHGFSEDMGVYNLSSKKKIKDYYDPCDLCSFIFPPPLWVEATTSTTN